MKYPVSEMCDRLSILNLKSERLPQNDETEAQIKEFRQALFEDVKHSDIAALTFELYTVNGKIWDLESDIRKGKEGDLGLEEVGRRALAIRDLNKIRIEFKNQIADILGEHKEIKGNHASQ